MKYQKPATERIQLLGQMIHGGSGIIICDQQSLVVCLPTN